MSDDVLIKVEGVSKKFCRSLKRSLWYGIQDVASELRGRKGNNDELRKNEFWAVSNVSFELRRGQCLGLIGPNGAGKSTLLKMLNGLIKPDTGKITMRGRIGALIELGAGFNPILTSRENIYVNGSILGFAKSEIDKKFDAIVDFAEIESALDTPVKNLSSGMKVRLGFAIAAQMEPDVLLIDEVLAVGDVGFRTKCLNSIRQIQINSSVIFVSHQMPEVARTCDRAMLMLSTKQSVVSENVPKVIGTYFEQFRNENSTTIRTKNGTLSKVRITDLNGKELSEICYGDDLIVEFEAEINSSIKFPDFGVSFVNQNLQIVLQSHTKFSNTRMFNVGGKILIRSRLRSLPLGPGLYYLTVGIDGENFGEIVARNVDCKSLRVTGLFQAFAPTVLKGEWHLESMKNLKYLNS